MPPKSSDLTVEHRLTKVEENLDAHIKTCERNSNEAKWWLRFMGSSLVLSFLGLLGKVAYGWIAGHPG